MTDTSWDEHDRQIEAIVSHMPIRKCMYYLGSWPKQCCARATRAFMFYDPEIGGVMEAFHDETPVVRLYCDKHFIAMGGHPYLDREGEILNSLAKGKYMLDPCADHG